MNSFRITYRLFRHSLPALVCLLLWTATPAKAQAGFGYTIYYDGVGSSALVQLSAPGATSFSGPTGLAVDLSGNLYIADTGNNRILKVAPGATIATEFTISGLGSPSTLSSPTQLAVDSAGNLYVADTGNNRIVEVSTSGSASILSTGSYTLSAPQGVAVDPSGDVFVSDTGNHRIIERPSGGSATRLNASGINLAATTPTALAVDSFGNLYIVDVAGNQVLEVNTSLQGSALNFQSETYATSSTGLVSPTSVTVANNGIIYITDPGAYRVAVIDPQGDNYDFLMNEIVGLWGSTQLAGLGGIATDSKGTVYLTNQALNQVFVLQQGSANFGHVTVGGSGTTLTLNFDLSPGIYGVGPTTTVNAESIYTAGAQTSDFTITGDNCGFWSYQGGGPCQVGVKFTPTAAGLRRGALVINFSSTSAYTYDQSGNFTVPLFGIGDAPVAAMSPGVASHLSTGNLTFPQAFEPFQTAYDGAGNIYVTDGPNNRVLMVPKGGGNATEVSIPALSPSPTGLSNPTGLAIDGAGNLFIADSGNNRIVEVTAGTSMVLIPCSISPEVWDLSSNTLNSGWGSTTPCDPNAPVPISDLELATPYTFNNPQSLFIDGSGNLIVNDAGNHALVQLAPNYYYTKDNTLGLSNAFVMATGSLSPGTSSSFAVDTNEGLYISDEANNRIIRVDRFGKTSIVNFSSLSTALTSPRSLALDPMGNLYVMDAGGASGAQRIVEEITGGSSSVVTTLPYTGAVTLGGNPNGLAVDSFGSLLASDFGGTSGSGFLTQIGVGQSAQAFPNTAVNGSSSPQTSSVTNIGDQALVFSANPTYTANFPENSGDTNLCASATSLAAGTSCDVSMLFTPQSAGTLSANITVTDDTQNTLGSTQQVSVSGTTSGELYTTSTTLTASPASPVHGQQVTLSATVASSGGTPTGTVTFSDLTTFTTLAANVALTSGVAMVTTSTLLTEGHNMTAVYSPTGNFLTSSGNTSVTITKASSGTALSLSNGVLTATVSAVAPGAGTPTGAVQFLNNGTLINEATLSGGVATLTVTPGTSYSYTAVYSGDNNFTGSASSAVTQTSIPTITAVSVLPGSAIYGQSVAITATVSSNSGTPTGTVTFTDQTTSTTLASNVTLVSGAAAVTASALGAASHTIEAVYTPAGNFLTSNGAKTVTMGKAATSTGLTYSNGTLTATVTVSAPGAGSPTGSVQFFNGNTLAATAPLAQGTATYNTLAFNDVTAVYSGDANFSGSTSAPIFAAPPNVTLGGGPNPSAFGQAVTFTATVTSASGTSGGAVQFSDGATPLGSGALNEGQASFSTTALAPGSHVIVATYGGASASMGQFVYGVPSTVTFTAAPTSVTLGQSVTLTAKLGPAPPQGVAAPTGQVVFRNNGSDSGSAPVAAGAAVLQVALAPGTHQLAALYTGDKNWAAGQSATATVTVGVAPTTTTLTPTMAANQIVLTASVATSAQGVGMPTGSVQFMDTGKNAAVGAATLSGGTGTATFAGNSAAAVEGRPIVAVYSGDANFGGSTSPALAQMANGAWNSTATFAPDEITSLYGIAGLNGNTTATPPLSTSLSGVTVTITDSTGTVFSAMISGVYAAANQINLLVPSGLAAGLATVTIALPGGGTIANVVNIAGVAPGIFTSNSTGHGVYAGQVVYVNADGSQTVASSNGPVNLRGGQQVYLALYGTGLRHAGSVTATVNGVSVPVAYFGGGAAGVDQVNVGPLPASLAGAGTVTLVITADGQAANPVTFTVQEPVE